MFGSFFPNFFLKISLASETTSTSIKVIMKDFFLRHLQKLDQGYMNLKNIVSGPILVNNCQYKCICSSTVEPCFNEVPRDWGNLFVILRVRNIECVHLRDVLENYQNVHYVEV